MYNLNLCSIILLKLVSLSALFIDKTLKNYINELNDEFLLLILK